MDKYRCRVNISSKIVIIHHGIDGSTDPMIANAVRVRDNLTFAVRELGFEPVPVYVDSHFSWASQIISIQPKLVFNAADLGFFCNNLYEPNIPAVLDGTKVPYTGSGSYSMYFSRDKFASKKYLLHTEVPVPGCWIAGKGRADMTFPIILKYRKLHNSEGITIDSVVNDAQSIETKLKSYDLRRDDVIAEQYIDGHEICAGFIGNKGGRKMLPVVVFDFGDCFDGRPKIRDFDAKWDKDSDAYSQSGARFAVFESDVMKKIEEYTSKIADLFDIKDYGRFDFRLKREKDGRFTPYIIDINANPDVNDDATLYKMAKQAGMTYTQFIGEIINTSLRRR